MGETGRYDSHFGITRFRLSYYFSVITFRHY
jgi:hypothetical protein